VRRPNFVTGFTQVFAALGFVWNTPATWPLVLVPAVLFGLLATAASIIGVVWVTPWALSLLPGSHGFWITAAEWAARLLLYLVSLIGGVWVALLLTPPLSGPALESLVAEQERALQLPERTPSGFFGELWLGFRAQAVAVGFALPVLVLLAVVELFVPPAAIITTPLGAMVTALALAWNLFDYPLTLHGVSASDRLGFVAANVGPVLGFGLGFSALFWIPCFGILMLPVGVVAATRLLHLLVQHDPDQLPSFPRALAAAHVPDPLSGATRPKSRERVGPAGNRGEG
jgi:CysZ protein